MSLLAETEIDICLICKDFLLDRLSAGEALKNWAEMKFEDPAHETEVLDMIADKLAIDFYIDEAPEEDCE